METDEGYGHLEAEWIAKHCDTSTRTAYRWKKRGPPTLARRWLEFLGTGLLDAVRPAWRGWRLRDDALIAPDGYRYTRKDIERLTWLQQNDKAQSIELNQLRAVVYRHGAHLNTTDDDAPALPWL